MAVMRRLAGSLKNGLLAALCVTGVVAATPAKATDTLSITSVAVPLYDSGINVSYGGTTWSGVIAGQIVLHGTDSAMPSTPAFNIYAWCVDLYHALYIGNNAYTFYVGTAVTTNGNGVAVSAATNSQLDTIAAYGNQLLAGTYAGNADVSTAIQLAIWQTEYSGLTFTGANSTVIADVAAYEAYAANVANARTASALLPASGQQQLITNTVSPSGSGSSNAPEPISATLLATGMIGLCFARRRRTV